MNNHKNTEYHDRSKNGDSKKSARCDNDISGTYDTAIKISKNANNREYNKYEYRYFLLK